MIKRISTLARLRYVSCELQAWITQAETYDLPRQLRGPAENGFRTEVLSFSNRGSPRKRSGTNELGIVKLLSE